jgi:transmembrane sensor
MHGSPTAEGRAAFIRWYRADPAHARTFDRISAGFDAALLLRDSELQHPRPGPAAAPRRQFQYAMAAALLAAICISLLLVLQERGSEAHEGRFMLATEVGEVRVVPLADGSRVTLDTDTSLAVDISEHRRQVTLQRGRARIAVSPAPAPFQVAVRAITVSTSRGEFDVAVLDDRAVVAPIRGSVQVAVAGENRTIVEGQRAELGADGAALESRPLARGEALWPTGMLEFDSTPLAQAVAQANRYSRVKIRLEGGAAAQHRVTGAFRSGEIAAFARGLAAAFDLESERMPTGDYLLRARTR